VGEQLTESKARASRTACTQRLHITDATRRAAVDLYATKLREAGMDVTVRDATDDERSGFELVGGGTAVLVDWASTVPAGSSSAEDIVDDEFDADDEGPEDVAGSDPHVIRMARHYGRTFAALARDGELAAQLLARFTPKSPTRASRRKTRSRSHTSRPDRPTPAGGRKKRRKR